MGSFQSKFITIVMLLYGMEVHLNIMPLHSKGKMIE